MHKVFEVVGPNTKVLYIDEAVILAQGAFGQLEETSFSFWNLECGSGSMICPGSNCPFLYSISIVGRLQTYSVTRFTHEELQKVIPSCVSNTTLTIKTAMHPYTKNINFEGT